MDLSIIVPVYNTAIEKLEDCFQSISKLMVANNGLAVECLIIDDGSGAEVSDWCKRFSESHTGYRFHKKNNEGVSVARNLGIDLAKGNYITFVDSDDLILPFEDLNRTLLSQEYDVIFTHLSLDKEKSKIWRAFDGGSRELQVIDVLNRIINDGTLNGPVSKLIRREFLRKYQVSFDRTMITGEDLVFLIQILMASPRLYYLDACTYVYNLDGGTSSNRLQKRPETFLANNQIMYQQIVALIEQTAEVSSQLALKIQATKRYLKQLFNCVAELQENQSLSLTIKNQLRDLLTLIDSEVILGIQKPVWAKSAIQYRVLSQEQWLLLAVVGQIRSLYLKLKKR